MDLSYITDDELLTGFQTGNSMIKFYFEEGIMYVVRNYVEEEIIERGL